MYQRKANLKNIKSKFGYGNEEDKTYESTLSDKKKYEFQFNSFIQSISEYNSYVSKLIDMGLNLKTLDVVFDIKYLDYQDEYHKLFPNANLQSSKGGAGTPSGGIPMVPTPDQLGEMIDAIFGTRIGPTAIANRNNVAQLGNYINVRNTELGQIQALEQYFTDKALRSDSNLKKALSKLISSLQKKGIINFNETRIDNITSELIKSFTDGVLSMNAVGGGSIVPEAKKKRFLKVLADIFKSLGVDRAKNPSITYNEDMGGRKAPYKSKADRDSLKLIVIRQINEYISKLSSNQKLQLNKDLGLINTSSEEDIYKMLGTNDVTKSQSTKDGYKPSITELLTDIMNMLSTSADFVKFMKANKKSTVLLNMNEVIRYIDSQLALGNDRAFYVIAEYIKKWLSAVAGANVGTASAPLPYDPKIWATDPHAPKGEGDEVRKPTPDMVYELVSTDFPEMDEANRDQLIKYIISINENYNSTRVSSSTETQQEMDEAEMNYLRQVLTFFDSLKAEVENQMNEDGNLDWGFKPNTVWENIFYAMRNTVEAINIVKKYIAITPDQRMKLITELGKDIYNSIKKQNEEDPTYDTRKKEQTAKVATASLAKSIKNWKSKYKSQLNDKSLLPFNGTSSDDMLDYFDEYIDQYFDLIGQYIDLVAKANNLTVDPNTLWQLGIEWVQKRGDASYDAIIDGLYGNNEYREKIIMNDAIDIIDSNIKATSAPPPLPTDDAPPVDYGAIDYSSKNDQNNGRIETSNKTSVEDMSTVDEQILNEQLQKFKALFPDINIDDDSNYNIEEGVPLPPTPPTAIRDNSGRSADFNKMVEMEGKEESKYDNVGNTMRDAVNNWERFVSDAFPRKGADSFPGEGGEGDEGDEEFDEAFDLPELELTQDQLSSMEEFREIFGQGGQESENLTIGEIRAGLRRMIKRLRDGTGRIQLRRRVTEQLNKIRARINGRAIRFNWGFVDPESGITYRSEAEAVASLMAIQQERVNRLPRDSEERQRLSIQSNIDALRNAIKKKLQRVIEIDYNRTPPGGGGGGDPEDPDDFDDMDEEPIRRRRTIPISKVFKLLVAILATFASGFTIAEGVKWLDEWISGGNVEIPKDNTPVIIPKEDKDPKPPASDDSFLPKKFLTIGHTEWFDSVGLSAVIDTYNGFVNEYNKARDDGTISDKDLKFMDNNIRKYYDKFAKVTNTPLLSDLQEAKKRYDGLRAQYDNALENGMDINNISVIYTELRQSMTYLDRMTDQFLKMEGGVFGTYKSKDDPDVTVDDADSNIRLVSAPAMNKQARKNKLKSPSDFILSKGMKERIERKLNRQGFGDGVLQEEKLFNDFSIVTPPPIREHNSLTNHNKRHEIMQYSKARSAHPPIKTRRLTKMTGQKPRLNNVVQFDDILDDAYYNSLDSTKLQNPYQTKSDNIQQFHKSKLYNPEYSLQKAFENKNNKNMSTGGDMIRSGAYENVNKDQYYQLGTIQYDYNEELNKYPMTRQKPMTIDKSNPRQTKPIRRKRIPNSYSLK